MDTCHDHIRRRVIVAMLPWCLTATLLCVGASSLLAAPGQIPGVLHTAVQPFVDRGNLAGAVMLVANSNQVLDVETAGYSDIADRKPMRPDNLFWIASQSKSMTATAFMMLVDEGKVSLDDPVENIFRNSRGRWWRWNETTITCSCGSQATPSPPRSAEPHQRIGIFVTDGKAHAGSVILARCGAELRPYPAAIERGQSINTATRA